MMNIQNIFQSMRVVRMEEPENCEFCDGGGMIDDSTVCYYCNGTGGKQE